MAQETAGVNIVIKSNAAEAVGSLRKQLKEAQADVTTLSDKFGATSEQAVAAAKRAADLRDRIGDAKALTDAFNPDRKFQAFASALQGVVGGFTAVQGALGLVGVESEDVQKTLLKVQSAMALSQGINSVLEARDSFKNLGAVIQSTAIFQKANNAATTIAIALQRAFGVATVQTSAAFRVLKGAIAATGIGLLVVGLTTLIGKIQEWTASTDSAAEAQKKLAAQTDLINAKLNNEIAILTAIGGKEDEVYRKKVEIANNELALLRKKFDDQKKFTIEEAKQFGELKTQLVVLEQEEKNRIAKIREEAAKKQKEKDKEAADKAKAVAKERIDGNKDADEQIRLQNQENFLLAIKDEDERAKKKLEFDLQNRLLEIEALNADEEKKKQLKLQALKSTALELSNLEEQLKAEKKEKEDADKKEEEEKLAKYNEQNNERIRNQFEYEKKLREDYYQADLEATKYLQEQKIAAIESGLNIISSLAGKNEAIGNIIYTIQKAIEIGRIISSTTGAIAKVKADTAAIPAFVGPGIPNPAFAAALAVGTKKILGLKIGAAASIASLAASSISKFKSGSSGGNVGGTQEGGAIAGAGAPIAPPTPQATLTQLDQSINRLGSATNRAYVVESDITNSQERIRRINRAARLN